ncbi:lysophospholipid acyltransferase family protein [Nocardioides sp. GY 10127]|uniref:lysophospholipid acyltransferase family protein n=1 Tax=Nocardioides sp. GY 10127 TaxID=2569762 RepID=UPI0010A944EF|nr:lysophospholipid acyltransferase family protein [Nocardioides sp. GY 10127]TIC85709.1 1-acyl-sn-glycerol-3-phosphate acyltransferase [Nocardioides sp. GY 10127]
MGVGEFLSGGVADVRRTARGFRWGRRAQVPRSAEPFVQPPTGTVFDTGWARRPSVVAAREVAQRVGLEPLFRAQVRTRVEGLDVLERLDGPVIFVANHASHLDTPLLLLSLPDSWRRRTAVAAAADYFFDTWWKAVGSSLVFNTFPIDRRGGSMAATPGEVLADGWSLVVYPEGTRSRDGWLQGFRMGAAYLAQTHGVPVVPVAHRGTFAAMPRGAGWPSRHEGRRREVTVRFGEPLRAREGESVRDFAPRIKDAVAALLDEERTSWYEARLRSAAGTTPDPAGPDVATWRRVWAQTEPVVTEPHAGRRPAPWSRLRAEVAGRARSALER